MGDQKEKDKGKDKAGEELGWLYVHAASAGGMSIAGWEILKEAMHGAALFLVYGGLTAASLASVLLHHKARR